MHAVVGIVIAILMAFIAKRKGFNPMLWILAGGGPGLIILAFMPSANAIGIDDAARVLRRKRGNSVGGAISCIVIVLIAAFFALVRNP